MKWQIVALSAAVLIFVAGCQTTSGNACDGWKPIRPLRADVDTMSDQLVEQILAHNEFGAKTCGWKK